MKERNKERKTKKRVGATLLQDDGAVNSERDEAVQLLSSRFTDVTAVWLLLYISMGYRLVS